MGLFKQVKDMKNVIGAAPGLIDQANQMGANAQAMQAQGMAQQQALMGQISDHQAAAAGNRASQAGGLDPIAGVGLETYVEIVKAIAPLGYDQSLLPGIAASHGIDGSSWQQAHDGWNTRIQSDPAVARAFSDIHRR